MTNGQELGDPNCDWSEGKTPTRTTNITHPGICEPWGSAKCETSNEWVSCDGGQFNCDAVNEPDVKSITLRFPETKVPASETNYFCFPFDMSEYLDMSQDYHLIATEPVINNSNVMHHLILNGCYGEMEEDPSPSVCYMSQDGCAEVVGVWSLGLGGTCEVPDAGYLIGKSGHKKMVMQLHWTNPELRTDYVDSSGLKLYYTPKKRKYNSGFFVTGQKYLFIEPGKQQVVTESSCTPEASNSLISDKIYLTSGLSHMHYLGYSESVELIRGGEKVGDVIDDPNYSYDNPVFTFYDPPIEVRQGDELLTKCVYRSTSRTTTTLYGEGSYDEMCFGFFSYYPRENVHAYECTQWKDFDIIKRFTNNSQIGDCNTNKFEDTSDPDTRALMDELFAGCNFYGLCLPECPAAVRKIRAHPCLQGRLGEYLLYRHARTANIDRVRFVIALQSCDDYDDQKVTMLPPTGSAGTVQAETMLFILCFITGVLNYV